MSDQDYAGRRGEPSAGQAQLERSSQRPPVRTPAQEAALLRDRRRINGLTRKMVRNRLKDQRRRFMWRLDRLMLLGERQVTFELMSTARSMSSGMDLDKLNPDDLSNLSAPTTRKVVHASMGVTETAELRAEYEGLAEWYVDLLVALATLKDAKAEWRGPSAVDLLRRRFRYFRRDLRNALRG